MKRLFAFVLAICMLTTAFAGCGQQANTPTEPKADQASTNEVEKKDEKPAKDVDLTFFTGKVETVRSSHLSFFKSCSTYTNNTTSH